MESAWKDAARKAVATLGLSPNEVGEEVLKRLKQRLAAKIVTGRATLR